MTDSPAKPPALSIRVLTVWFCQWNKPLPCVPIQTPSLESALTQVAMSSDHPGWSDMGDQAGLLLHHTDPFWPTAQMQPAWSWQSEPTGASGNFTSRLFRSTACGLN